MSTIANILRNVANHFDPASKLQEALRANLSSGLNLSACNATDWQSFAQNSRSTAGGDGSMLQGWTPDAAGQMKFAEISCPNPVSAADKLCDQFDVFAIPCSQQTQGDLYDAMRILRATWCVRSLPDSLGNGIAVFLPKDDARSRLAARVMREHGAADLGAHLKKLMAPPQPQSMRPDNSPKPAGTWSAPKP